MWQGTDYNERLFNGARNALVEIYLWGVRGVSTPHGYPASKQVSASDADKYIARGRLAYAKLVAQEAPRSAKGWHEHKIKELNGLIEKAAAVRDGGPQKMTAADYAAYRKSLGL